ncbi:hypothetical protein EMCRGX_G000043 [Ephydatia muelleri]
MPSYATFEANFQLGWAQVRKNMHPGFSNRVEEFIHDCWQEGVANRVKVSAEAVVARLAEEYTSRKIQLAELPVMGQVRGSYQSIGQRKIANDAGAILASLDVVSLYTNIPHKEGIASVHKATLESESPRVEAATLAELTIMLKNNILEFAGENFLQVQGSENELNQYVADCNTTHESIKVTCVQSTTEVTFLDVTVSKGPKFHSTGYLDFKTHIKETNSRAYVHASS